MAPFAIGCGFAFETESNPDSQWHHHPVPIADVATLSEL
eukprot:CAMPEP_0197054228 /NCGR_PEP_ID=MMETSP1384-20130603/36484_1 /TAXON_ID=29189 /ORGANISM="Ammonia sp." /LENGTH=38 /DNA_ID= /DNA_START= /DNA_END= /DNA_ORIENTATION=